VVWTVELDDEPLDEELPELVAAVAPVPLVVPDDVELDEVPDPLDPAAWLTVAAVESWIAMTPVRPRALVALTTAAILRARAARGLRTPGNRFGTRGSSFMTVTVRTPVEESPRAR
jgi:hypothetical protein